jgi:hypothetical protein
VARIGNEVVKLRTDPPSDRVTPDLSALIVAQSHRRYYQPTGE